MAHKLPRTRSAMRSKTSNNRLLVVVDESSSSKSAVEYVARMLRRRRGFQLCLAHFLPPLPPILLEFGGAEDPEKERRLDAQLKTEQQQWIAAARKKAEPALDWARSRLRKAGVPAASLITQFSDPASEQDSVNEEILELARRNKCHTIVVGTSICVLVTQDHRRKGSRRETGARRETILRFGLWSDTLSLFQCPIHESRPRQFMKSEALLFSCWSRGCRVMLRTPAVFSPAPWPAPQRVRH